MRVPDLLVERLALGELSAAQAAEVRRRLEEEPGGLARLEAIAASNQQILAAYPPRALMRPPSPSRAWLWVPALAAAASLLVGVALWRSPNPPNAGVEEGVRAKGLRPSLQIHRRSGRDIEQLRDGALAQEGDELQLSYLPAGQRYGVVLSVDGNGALTLHLPLEEGPAAELGQGETLLPRAYVLDDAPRYERFYLFSSELPFTTREVTGPARAAGETDPQVPAGLSLHRLELRKSP